MPDAAYLPPAAKLNLTSGAGRKTATGEMAQPASVTEHTTRLLSDNEV
jgi:hypothetical protein